MNIFTKLTGLTLISNWKQFWRFSVMWFQGFGASAMATWMLLSDEQRGAIAVALGVPPSYVVAFVALSVFIASGFARVTKQNLPPPGASNETQ